MCGAVVDAVAGAVFLEGSLGRELELMLWVSGGVEEMILKEYRWCCCCGSLTLTSFDTSEISVICPRGIQYSMSCGCSEGYVGVNIPTTRTPLYSNT